MTISKTGEAGTAESGDILVSVAPGTGLNVEVTGKPVILKQFGRQIRELIEKTAREAGVTDATITAKDNSSLDFTIKARVRAAIQRAE